MFRSWAKKFPHVDQLIQQGYIEKALQELEQLEKGEKLTEEDYIRGKLLKSLLFTEKTLAERGLQLAEEALEASRAAGNQLLEMDALIAKTEVLEYLGRFPGADPPEHLQTYLQWIEQSERLLATIPALTPLARQERAACLKRYKGIIYRTLEELERSLQYYQESLALCEDLGNVILLGEIFEGIYLTFGKIGDSDRELKFYEQQITRYEETDNKLTMAWCLGRVSDFYRVRKSDIELAVNYQQKCAKMWENIENKGAFAAALNKLGMVQLLLTDQLEQCLENVQKSLELAEELEDKRLMANNLIRIGTCYNRLGKPTQALNYFQSSLEILENFPRVPLKIMCFLEMGSVYRDKGELKHALTHYQESLAVAEEIESKYWMKYWMTPALTRIGTVYQAQGESDVALSCFKRALAMAEETNVRLHLANALHNLIALTLEQNSSQAAQTYLARLQEVAEATTSSHLHQLVHFSQALVLKYNVRLRDKLKAQELFEQLVHEKVTSHDLTTATILHLCELFLLELRLSGHEGLLQEVKTWTNRLLDIAQASYSHSVEAETYLLMAKLALLELDVKGARKLLDQAQTIAEEKGLRRLAMRISSEHDSLLPQLSQWEDFIDRNVPLVERVDLAHLEEQVVRMIRQRVEELPEPQEEVPEMVLIIGADSGLSVFSKAFHPDRPLAEQLIAGFLTAINAFGHDAFAVGGSIERVQYADYTLLLKTVAPFLVSYVFQGPSFFALQKLEKFIEAMQASIKVWGALKQALQTRRFVTEEKRMDILIKEIFHHQ